ncbi:MAG: hypothetical protein LBB74_06290 [Chitinispirillales bacterium]|nr:hypothetical protein [Chitinispirillales bacterium]
MAKGNPPPRGGRGGAGFVPPKQSGNKSGLGGKAFGGKRGNLPPPKK